VPSSSQALEEVRHFEFSRSQPVNSRLAYRHQSEQELGILAVGPLLLFTRLVLISAGLDSFARNEVNPLLNLLGQAETVSCPPESILDKVKVAPSRHGDTGLRLTDEKRRQPKL
jgi:hypothetical protein